MASYACVITDTVYICKHYRIKGVTCTVLVWESNCQSQKDNKIIKYVVQSWVEMWPSEHATSIVSPEMVGW